MVDCVSETVMICIDPICMRDIDDIYSYESGNNLAGCDDIVSMVVVRKAAEAGVTPIAVDNTHTQAWEMEPYVKMCLQHGYRPVIAEPNTPWRYKAKDLAKYVKEILFT